jgi:hypothetical protein
VKKGFKRITTVVAIVTAVACGIAAGFLPVKQYFRKILLAVSSQKVRL